MSGMTKTLTAVALRIALPESVTTQRRTFCPQIGGEMRLLFRVSVAVVAATVVGPVPTSARRGARWPTPCSSEPPWCPASCDRVVVVVSGIMAVTRQAPSPGTPSFQW